jgi:hypothetical protein
MEENNEIYRGLAGIGIEISGARSNRKADIERTILSASTVVDSSDRRLLGLLASWITTHGSLVWVGKLKRLILTENLGDPQVMSALAFLAVSQGFYEWKPLATKHSERVLWDSAATRAALELKGPEENFAKAGLHIPKSFLRLRTQDILPLAKLSDVHLQTKLRLIFGTNLRADAVFYLMQGSSSPTELMKKIGCSYEPAHRVFNDLQMAGTFSLPILGT